MNHTELAQRIEQVGLDRRIWIVSHALTSLPESIGEFTNLTELRLDYNELTSLPVSLALLV
jgi:Leucine-rich repeat (LRR) protein